MIFFSLIFFSVKKGVEIKFNDVLDTKQTFFVYKNKILQSLKKAFFQRDNLSWAGWVILRRYLNIDRPHDPPSGVV